MQDSQDNTFPIPSTGDTANSQAGNTTPPPPANDSSGLGFTPAPPPDINQQPVAPDWTNQATADAAQLPPGVDEYSINSTAQPGVASPAGLPLSPAPAPDPNVAPPQTINTDSGIPPTPIPPDPNMDPNQAYQQPAMPAQPDPAAYPQQPMDQMGQTNIPAQPPYDPNAMQPMTAVPPANTLDLSNQPMGSMQPGVEIAPQMNVQDGTMPATDMGGIPPDFGNSYNTEATDMMGAQASKSRFPMKFILIGAGALGFIIILSLVLVFVNRNQRTPAVDLNEAVIEETQTPEETSTPAEIPEGYKKVERDCFSFGVLLPTTVNFTPTTCKISAKFGSVSQYNLVVKAVTDPVTDLQGLVDQAKVGTITNQEDIKLNGVDAKKIIQKINGLDQQDIVVIPANKNYQLEGSAINGFIITTSFSDDTSKTASDNLVSTWAWK